MKKLKISLAAHPETRIEAKFSPTFKGTAGIPLFLFPEEVRETLLATPFAGGFERLVTMVKDGPRREMACLPRTMEVRIHTAKGIYAVQECVIFLRIYGKSRRAIIGKALKPGKD